MNLNDLIITKVKDITMYQTLCPNCGWKNSLDVIAHYGPKCGKDLYCMTLTAPSGMSKNSECIGGVDYGR